MYLQGQHDRRPGAERGIAMAALLVSLGVMSVLMAAALPAWRHQAQREKEAELIFRGEQYVRAIALWERRMGPGSRPANFDILVQQRFLRKKYKDPMTEDGEFQPLFVGVNPQGPGGAGGRGGRGGLAQFGPGVEGQTPMQLGGSATGGRGGGQLSGGAGGGILGVVSKSKERSIRLYKGQSTYNTWQFIHAGAAQTPGGVGGAPRPGGPGQQGPGFPGRGGRGPGGVGPGGVGPGRGTGPFGPGRGGRGEQPPPPGQGLPPGAGPGRGRGQ